MGKRIVAIHLHIYRTEAVAAASACIESLNRHDILVALRADHLEFMAAKLPDAQLVNREDPVVEADCELVLVFGGDGTILRAAEWAISRDLPLMGVNLGHVGFLAELESSEAEALIDSVVNRTYSVEERMTVDVQLLKDDGSGYQPFWESFAINEMSLEKQYRERMIDVGIEVDGRPLSRFGTDGVLVATPTGSTAYAFSAQGPVVWPDLSAILLVPVCAHALFARPMVLSPKSVVRIKVIASENNNAVLCCDGRRSVDVGPGMLVEVTCGRQILKLARMNHQPFVDRLVRKFQLPITGWRTDKN